MSDKSKFITQHLSIKKIYRKAITQWLRQTLKLSIIIATHILAITQWSIIYYQKNITQWSINYHSMIDKLSLSIIDKLSLNKVDVPEVKDNKKNRTLNQIFILLLKIKIYTVS